ncbi:MAG: hypothetical protein HY928_08990 [Elusimicrobia bacterium]|nr:hypothetical protein [Elusimicrobiota bacterium]
MLRTSLLAVALAVPAAARLPDPVLRMDASPALRELLGAAADAAVDVPALPGQELDALGRPVSAETRREYERILRSLNGKTLRPSEYDLILALLNQPPLPPGPFKDREALARWFAKQGVGLRQTGGNLADSDLWRLVRAARAASVAYRIPPAILMCLTFRESAFNRGASAWTTSAKGVGQLTNGAVSDMVARIQRDPELGRQTREYASLLGASMPTRFVGAPDVDALTKELAELKKNGAPAAEVAAKKKARAAAIAAHKDEPGHIFNIETNFGLTASYLATLRRSRLSEVTAEDKGWYTAVAAYNQGVGTANELIYKVYPGPAAYNAAPLAEIFSTPVAARLALSHERQEEMLGEVGSVLRCAGR